MNLFGSATTSHLSSGWTGLSSLHLTISDCVAGHTHSESDVYRPISCWRKRKIRLTPGSSRYSEASRTCCCRGGKEGWGFPHYGNSPQISGTPATEVNFREKSLSTGKKKTKERET